jgi:hypothetical protein
MVCKLVSSIQVMYLSQIIIIYCVVLPLFSEKYIKLNLVHYQVSPNINKLATARTWSIPYFWHIHALLFSHLVIHFCSFLLWTGQQWTIILIIAPNMIHTSTIGPVHRRECSSNRAMWDNLLGCTASVHSWCPSSRWNRDWRGTICIVQPCLLHNNRLHKLDWWLLQPSPSNTVHKEYKFINYYALCNTAH